MKKLIMSGQMRKYDFDKYYKQLETMPEPVMTSELPRVRLNIRGIRQYARQKGVSIASLLDAEKSQFMIPVNRGLAMVVEKFF